jgi:hypothetical protein
LKASFLVVVSVESDLQFHSFWTFSYRRKFIKLHNDSNISVKPESECWFWRARPGFQCSRQYRHKVSCHLCKFHSAAVSKTTWSNAFENSSEKYCWTWKLVSALYIIYNVRTTSRLWWCSPGKDDFESVEWNRRVLRIMSLSEMGLTLQLTFLRDIPLEL